MSAAANDGAANRKQEIATDLMETRFRRLSFSASVLSLSFFPSAPLRVESDLPTAARMFEAKTQFAAVFGERFVTQ